MFIKGTRIAKITKVFGQTIIRYINKPKHVVRPYLALIIRLRLLFVLYTNFSITRRWQKL